MNGGHVSFFPGIGKCPWTKDRLKTTDKDLDRIVAPSLNRRGHEVRATCLSDVMFKVNISYILKRYFF